MATGFSLHHVVTAPETLEPYEGTEWQEFVLQAKLGLPFLFEDDVDIYEWHHQKMILTEQASLRLINKYGASLDWLHMSKLPFIAALGPRRIYGGRFIHIQSQDFLPHPVIYPEVLGVQVNLYIRPFHSGSLEYPCPLTQRIENDLVKERFLFLHKWIGGAGGAL